MLKKAVSFILAVVLILGMSACAMERNEGNGFISEEGMPNPGTDAGMSSQTRSNDESSVQYAYSNLVVDFTAYGSDAVVHDMAAQGNRLYVLLEMREWEPEPEDNMQKWEYTSCYQVFTCFADGSQKQVSRKFYLPEGGYVNEMCLSDTGNVAALFYSDTDESVSLLFWDGFGDTQWEKKVASGGHLFWGQDGFAILARNGEGRTIISYDSQGELAGSIEVEGEIFGDFLNCFLTSEGNFFLVKTDQEGKAYGELYDPGTGSWEYRELPDDLSRYQVFPGTTADFLLCDSVGVYQVDAGLNLPTEILTYVDVDLDIEGFQVARQIDETRLAGIFSDVGGVAKLGIFERVEVPAEAQKQIVELGTMSGLDGGLRRQIIAFNQTSSGYRITVKQYADDEELDALAQLNTDILAGRMPDILLIDSKMPLQSYIAKGMLADVGKLLEEDRELDKRQFLENVCDAFRVNGILYYVIPSFSVDTLVAKQSKVGDKTGWNHEEFAAVMAGLPGETEMVSEMSRYEYLEDYMRVCGREYIDTDQGICDFQSQTFVSVLEFSATLPEHAESYGLEENSYGSQYIENRALLQPVTIRYIPNLAQQIYGCIGEDIAYVGYPAESREGSCISICGTGFVLSGQSDKLEGAWEFVRYFLTEDFQRDKLYEIEGSGLPTRRDVFDEKAQIAAMQEGYCFIEDEFVSVPPMTQEQIDKAVNFIMGLHNPAFEDEVIMNIIYEEAESFFQGQKTAEDVAGFIQNRVQLYLSESR